MRYFIEFSYDGSLYAGMQFQKNAITIQEVIEDALSKKIEPNIKITPAGRTDAGVHARQMMAHFDSELEINSLKLIKELNSYLPHSMVICSIKKVQSTAHARFDAISRKYYYYISTKKNPFNEKFSYSLYYKTLDVDKMNDAAKLLVQYTDFTSFAKLHSPTKTNICNITQAIWIKEHSQLIFKITADRFLRNMVRSIVGTLIDVGLEKINTTKFCEIIELKERKFAGVSAPAKGLFLHSIIYDENIFI